MPLSKKNKPNQTKHMFIYMEMLEKFSTRKKNNNVESHEKYMLLQVFIKNVWYTSPFFILSKRN